MDGRRIPVDGDSRNGQKANADVSVSQEGHQHTEEPYVRPAGVDEPDGVEG